MTRAHLFHELIIELGPGKLAEPLIHGPVQPNASMRQGQNADERASEWVLNATVRRWNVAYGGPYYDYVPGIMASV